MAETVNRIGSREFRGTLGANGDTVTLPCREYGTAGIAINGTFSGSVTVEGSVDGTNWTKLKVHDLAQAAVVVPLAVTGAPNTNNWQSSIVPCDYVRIKCTAWTSGTATVKVVLNCGVTSTFSVTN